MRLLILLASVFLFNLVPANAAHLDDADDAAGGTLETESSPESQRPGG